MLEYGFESRSKFEGFSLREDRCVLFVKASDLLFVCLRHLQEFLELRGFWRQSKVTTFL